MVTDGAGSQGGLATRLAAIIPETSTEGDYELMAAFVTASHTTRGPILGCNKDVVLFNAEARHGLKLAEQTVLHELAAQALATNTPMQTTLELSGGRPMRVH